MNGPSDPETTAVEITAVETGVLAPLALLVVLIGVYPAPFLDLIGGSVAAVVHLLGTG
jgi:NADH:ubiquinone oxidoreductase subunit 4 (subunit M)